MDEKKPRIMIVDDTIANLKLLDSILRNQGYRVFSFPRGDQAVKGAEKNPPDLILLDINMPGLDGFQVCERLKSDDRFKDIPILFISALSETSDKVKAFQAGGVDYITKPFQVEEVIARVETHLSLRRYQGQLMDAKKKAEAASEAKSEFLANMSHEIRTPMSAVIGFLELVLEDAALPEVYRQHLFSAHISARSLLGLINDILDLTKLEIGKMQILQRPFHLPGLIHEVYETMDINAQKKGLQLEVEMDPSLPEVFMGDPLRIRQILLNLIGNAVKFTDQGKVDVRIRPAKEQGQLCFTIEDTGMGMPGDLLNKIFEPFVQADSFSTRQFKGTGLGTTISRRLVEQMGGRIWAESEEGKGSVFHFIIDLLPTDQLPDDTDLFIVPGKAILQNTSRPFRVLLAEDTEMNVELIKFRLEQQGHRIELARNGREAVEAFQKEKFDLILMDIRMPEIDGIEATKQIRALETGTENHVPIIVLTASLMRGETKDYLAMGMDAVVAKPINFNKLFKAMEDTVPVKQDQKTAQNNKGGRTLFSSVQASKADNSLPEALPGIDIQDALKRVGGNPVFLKKILKKFSDSQKNVVEQIQAAISSGDRDQAVRLTHTLKGLAGTIGAGELFEVSKNLEAAIKTDKNNLNPLLSKVSGDLMEILESIDSVEKNKKYTGMTHNYRSTVQEE